jgi:hypothetical protein
MALSVSHGSADGSADGVGGEEAEGRGVGFGSDCCVPTSFDDILVHLTGRQIRPNTATDGRANAAGEVVDCEEGKAEKGSAREEDWTGGERTGEVPVVMEARSASERGREGGERRKRQHWEGGEGTERGVGEGRQREGDGNGQSPSEGEEEEGKDDACSCFATD